MNNLWKPNILDQAFPTADMQRSNSFSKNLQGLWNNMPGNYGSPGESGFSPTNDLPSPSSWNKRQQQNLESPSSGAFSMSLFNSMESNTRHSPVSFSNGFSNSSNTNSYNFQQQHSPPQQQRGNGANNPLFNRDYSNGVGFRSTMSSNGANGGGGGNNSGGGVFDTIPMFDPSMNNGAFDRSISTNNFENFRGGVNLDRQLSAPSLRDANGLVNGFRGMNSNNGMSMGNDQREYHSRNNSEYHRSNGANNKHMSSGNNYMRDNSNSPPLTMYANNSNRDKGANTMTIGTWNEADTSSTNTNGSGFPTISNFEIGTFNCPTSSNSNNTESNVGGTSQSGNVIQGGPGIRETGIIEKLLHSYGFIQCCDRQARLFFHFSQYDGRIEHLKIGDPVEFEMTYDRRTGKPIASLVKKIAPELVITNKRLYGTVTTCAKIYPETGSESQGRISYEKKGECFFLPFTLSDIEGKVTITAGDEVSFEMSEVKESGNIVAKNIRLENTASPVRYQGMITFLDTEMGSIERADVISQISFIVMDNLDGDNKPLKLGDDVEFNIDNKDGKEVATNISILPVGTVVFEDVDEEYQRGQVLKTIDKQWDKKLDDSSGYNDVDGHLNGTIKYRPANSNEIMEIKFGEKDQVGEFTMKHGDWVRFVIAIDRRDKKKRATQIELLEDSFNVSDERRENGRIQSIQDGFGFIQCVDRNAKVLFHCSEILDVKRTTKAGDDVAFTITTDQFNRQLAIRIKHLPDGIVQFDEIVRRECAGSIEVAPSPSGSGNNSPTRNEDPKGKPGKIKYRLDNKLLRISLYASDCNLRSIPQQYDDVTFDISQCKATKETKAVNIHIFGRRSSKQEEDRSVSRDKKSESESSTSGNETVHYGYVAAMKDGFGFLETVKHDKEIFFHFSNVKGNIEKFDVGMEVRYTIMHRDKASKLSAEDVTLVEKGTITQAEASEDILLGKVVRSLRSVNPDQEEYCGLIQVRNDEGVVVGRYEFGIASLRNKKDLLQIGDPIQFQVSKKEPNFALNIKSTKEKQRAFVEAMKGQFGFLSFEAEEGKKLFFHTTEVENNDVLQQGDEVEFVLVTNKRSGKHSACCVRKISSSKRPERLISKLKNMNLIDAASGKRFVVIRQPKGPDGSGFKLKRKIAEKN